MRASDQCQAFRCYAQLQMRGSVTVYATGAKMLSSLFLEMMVITRKLGKVEVQGRMVDFMAGEKGENWARSAILSVSSLTVEDLGLSQPKELNYVGLLSAGSTSVFVHARSRSAGR